MPRTLTRLDVEVPGTEAPVKARLYRTSATCERALVWVHGGAFAYGDIDMPEADAVAGWLAERGWAVLSVDYRLAAPYGDDAVPGVEGHPFPAAHHDVVAAFDWMVSHAADLGTTGDSVLLGGASAGANLSAGAAVALRDRGEATPAGLLLAYPIVHAAVPDPSPAVAQALATLPADMRFSADVIRGMNLNYVGRDEAILRDPRAFAGEGDVAGLPPTIIVDSEADDLRPSGERFAAQLEAAGVDSTHDVEPGTTHGHLNRPEEPAFALTLTRFLEWSASR